MPRVKFGKTSLVMLLSVLSMVSCVTVTLTDVGSLRKGMTMEEAKASLPLPPKNEFPVETGDTIQTQICTYVISSGNYSSNYFLAFRDNKLFFWGYPHEFARSADPLINEIGEKAAATQIKLDAQPWQDKTPQQQS
jgi:hypothetical protein